METSTKSCPKNLSSHDNIILERLFNPALPVSDIEDDKNNRADTEDEPLSLNEAESKRLEVEGVKAAENGALSKALAWFNKAIDAEPNNASAYNNRAQAKRLSNDNQGALNDLNTAIDLSHSEGKAASQAYTQRGLINKLDGNNEAALEDFKKAANLGNKFAKQMVISLNPYAALCNQMMSEMITKVKKGEA